LFQILIQDLQLPLAFYLQCPWFHLLAFLDFVRIVFHCVWKRGIEVSMFRWYLDFAVPFSDLFPLMLVPWTFYWKGFDNTMLLKAVDQSTKL